MLSLRILHVEDDPDDAFFLSRAIKGTHLNCEIHLETNGEGAINYLRHASAGNKSNQHVIPELMILDLKLPRLTGFEVLTWTRNQPEFKTLPIIVLSGSSLAEDQTRAAGLGASEFIVKHGDYDSIAQQIIQFISKNALPGPTAA